MNKIVLFSPNGYVGSNIKAKISKNDSFKLFEITRDFDWNADMEDMDVFIYSAAITREREERAEVYICDNALTAVKVTEFCQRHHVKRIIYLSSDEIYGKLNTEQVDEKALMVEPNIYAITKYLAERIILDSGIPCFILRLPGIVGKKWGKSFVYRLMDKISQELDIELYNADKYFNNMIDIDDLIGFIELLAGDVNSRCSEIFVLGNTEKIKLGELVEYIKELYCSTSSIIYSDSDCERYFVLDTEKAVAYGYRSKKIMDVIDNLYRYDMMVKSNTESEKKE